MIRTNACVFGLLVFSVVMFASDVGSAVPRRAVIAYFTEVGAGSGAYPVKKIVTSGAARMVTQIDYAFGRVVNGRCGLGNPEAALEHVYDSSASVDGTPDDTLPGTLRGSFHQLQELKKLFPDLKMVISLGGWGGSGGFSTAAEPPNLRDFVKSCVDMFIRGRFASGIEAPGIFDGIDIDWEYPVEGGVEPGKPEDKANFTAMVAEFRRQLDEVRPGLLLTAALPAEEEYFSHFELKEVCKFLDSISIMAYDLHWNTEPITNFHSALFHDPADPSPSPLNKRFGDYAVQEFLKAGVPAQKIIFGVPFYGKGWQGVPGRNDGLYRPAQGPAQAGGTYRELSLLPHEAKRRYYSRVAACSIWSNGVFWSYDCPQALRQKRKYVSRNKLGGIMFWELSQDTDKLELLRSLSD